MIFSDGDDGGIAFVIESGQVEISKNQNGQKLVLGVLGQNAIFGELAVLGEGPRMATATALESTVCLAISESEIQSRMDSTDPFMRTLIRILVDNLTNTSKHIFDGEDRRQST